jgi:hypothetical protein
MRKFFKKIFLFSSVFAAWSIISFTINYFIIKSQKPPLKNCALLIAGDSHLQKAIDPSLLEDAQNISQPAEPYILTFWKLKEILKTIKPKRIMMGFGPHNISANEDLKFSANEWAEELFQRSYTFSDFSSIKTIKVDYFAYCKTIWKQMALYPKTNHIYYVGEFSNSDFNNTGDVIVAIERHYYNENHYCGISETSIGYLDSIIGLCHKNNIQLSVVNTPVHKTYFDLIPPQAFVKYIVVKEKLMRRGIEVQDHASSIYPDSLYLNSDHLNKNGAARFTNEIRNAIAKSI